MHGFSVNTRNTWSEAPLSFWRMHGVKGRIGIGLGSEILKSVLVIPVPSSSSTGVVVHHLGVH